jgi:hypothetical protein
MDCTVVSYFVCWLFIAIFLLSLFVIYIDDGEQPYFDGVFKSPSVVEAD